MKAIKKLYNALISTRFTALLFLLFALAMGVATFIENDFNTETSKALVFNTWWFNLILFLLVLNFIGNIKRYRLLQKNKLAILLLHLSFIIIIAGAAVTRYISFEGVMPIDEGESSSMLLSEKKYLSVAVDDNLSEKKIEKELLLAQQNANGKRPIKIAFLDFLRGGNGFKLNNKLKENPFEIQYVDYVPNATALFEASDKGTKHLHLVESSQGARQDHYLRQGERLSLTEADITFQDPQEGVISIYEKEGELRIKSHRPLGFTVMATQEQGAVEPFVEHKLKTRTLYTVGNLQFVIPSPLLVGALTYTKAENTDDFPLDMLKVRIKTQEEEKEVAVFGARFSEGEPTQVRVGKLNFSLRYGSKKIALPFSIQLNDFVLEKYPGSNSPKSFTSELTVKDADTSFDAKVFMNNVLDYRGYRFFQSSYEETGKVERTILSVNYDTLGTWVTYVGYMVLFFAMLFMLGSPQSYFVKQKNRLERMKNKLGIWAIAIISSFAALTAQSPAVEGANDVLQQAQNLPEKQVEAFSKLILQDPGGRMKPVNTFGSELLRKLIKKDEFQGLSSDQIILSLYTSPEKWREVPIIFINKNNSKLRDLIGIPHEQERARLSDFFNEQGEYILGGEVLKASKKKIKNKYEQSVMNVDGRVILLYLALEGDLFQFIPVPNDSENKWVTASEAQKRELTDPQLGVMAERMFAYKKAIATNSLQSLSEANGILSEIKSFQHTYGKEIMPTDRKVELELFYNKNDIFKNLFWQYMLASLFLFVTVIIAVFKDKSKWVHIVVKVAIGIVILLFVYHTVGLGIRWYISGHAPWSNGYESMIYVAWATLLFGLLIGRKSGLTIAATTFVTSMILMVAHWNWMDPSIGNLVPVLDSYWLMIHVAIIVASYGPFAIGMILGMMSLILFVISTEKNKEKLKKVVTELTIITDLSLTIGLVMLTIGNFLGAIWANESWGRYWGWDPKETWALISIMIYAFVLHMRLVPGLRGKLNFNIAAVFAFASILMTYLGVNHLLSGLHSYAAGAAAPIPKEIIGWLVVAGVLSILAILKKKYRNKASLV